MSTSLPVYNSPNDVVASVFTEDKTTRELAYEYALLEVAVYTGVYPVYASRHPIRAKKARVYMKNIKAGVKLLNVYPEFKSSLDNVAATETSSITTQLEIELKQSNARYTKLVNTSTKAIQTALAHYRKFNKQIKFANYTYTYEEVKEFLNARLKENDTIKNLLVEKQALLENLCKIRKR